MPSFDRVGPGSKYMLGRMKTVIDAHSDALESIKGEDGIGVRENYKGGVTIYLEDNSLGGGGSPATWSGIVWHLGNILYDFNKTDNSPLGSASEYGLVGVSEDFVYSGSVLGEYLKIKLNDGGMAWVDGADIVTSIADIDDKDEYEYFRVATIAGEDSASNNIYVLAENRTVGDIRIPYAPYIAEIEEQEE